MANRRMFSKGITESDRFLSMGTDVQNLYFHLGMQADDDGFVSPRRVMRMIGAADDSLKHLVMKEFVIPFESGVVVVTDWRENNLLKNDRHKPTQYQRELAQLSHINGRYALGIQNGSRMVPQDSIGKDRLLSEIVISPEKEELPKREKKDTSYLKIYELWGKYPANWKLNKTQIVAAKNLLEEHGLETVGKAFRFYQRHHEEQFCPQITSPYDLDSKWLKLVAFKEKTI